MLTTNALSDHIQIDPLQNSEGDKVQVPELTPSLPLQQLSLGN